MRYIAILLLLGVTLKVNAQQINPVPDYIFRNQMSVGRNAPTDTAAYMSIGPRYGAVKGFMPPMVVDTNAVTGTKRNGLLIFSVQLNNFAYWDSTTSRFRQITAQATVDSLVFATRAWRKKGDDSLGAVIATRTDTALLSTKAYRQKAVDSLVTLISTLGGGTVLSVGSGYGTNFSTITTSGSVVVDSLVITSRASRDKLKDSLNANIALKVNISDTSTMLGAYLRKADTTSMLSPYLRKGDTTAMLSPYVRTAGFGLTKGTQTLSVDSALMATRARVQKGIDSVASLVAAPDSLLFSTRAWRQKGDDSLGAIIGTKATATGTTNYLSKFTGTSSLGNSIVYATTSEVGISTPSPTHPLDVNGRVRVRTIDSTATGMNMLYADVDGVIKKAAVPAGGTVTSVAAGTGMSFTTITSTGSVNADTVALSTRAWRQKGIDSVANLSRVTGSGTTNFVAKFTGSTAVGNSLIFDNGTNVGIGTSSPLQKLDIQSTDAVVARLKGGSDANEGASYFITNSKNTSTLIAIGDRATAFGGTTDSLTSIFTGTAPLLFDIAGSNRGRITAQGEYWLGGGTDAGDYRLQVDGSIYNTTGAVLAASSGGLALGTTLSLATFDVNARRLVLGNGTGSEGITMYSSTTGNGYIMFADGTTGADLYRGYIGYHHDGNFMAIGTNGTDVIRILSSGNVGIGTTSPQQKFVVSNAGAEGVEFVPGTSNIIQSYNRSTSAFTPLVSRASIHNIQIGTDAALYIDTSRNVGIGTTSPTYRLHLPGQTNTANQAMIAGVVFGSDGNGQTIKPSGSLALTIFGQNDQSYLYGASIGGEGRWGVGTTSPSYVFDVNGTMRSTGNTFLATTASNEVIIGGTTDAGAHTLQVIGNIYNTTGAVLAASSGNVGIGTTGPARKLGIVTPDGTASQIQLLQTARRDYYIGVPASQTYFEIFDASASANRFTVSSGGNIGIGTTSPNGKLTIKQGDAQVDITTGTDNITYEAIDRGTLANPVNILTYARNGYHAWFTGAYGERMRIINTGEVGIGTTAPSERLHVNGRARIATIDSSASPINMLWADVNGVIRKAAVPAGGGGSADSAVFATRARVQKAVDSINNVNASGTGISNYITRWTGTKTMDTSQIIQVNGNIGIGTSSPGSNKLSVTGATLLNGNVMTNATSGFGVYVQQVINETGMVIVSQRDPLGADTVVAAIGFGSNTHQAPARINAISAQAWNSNDRGVYLSFRVTPNSTTQNYEMMRIQQDGEVVIGQNYADQGTYRLQVDGNTFTNGSIKTSAPAGGTSGQWKLGTRVASSVALDATQYIEVDIGGTLYYLATVSFLEPKPKP
jgi:hypothetical protein